MQTEKKLISQSRCLEDITKSKIKQFRNYKYNTSQRISILHVPKELYSVDHKVLENINKIYYKKIKTKQINTKIIPSYNNLSVLKFEEHDDPFSIFKSHLTLFNNQYNICSGNHSSIKQKENIEKKTFFDKTNKKKSRFQSLDYYCNSIDKNSIIENPVKTNLLESIREALLFEENYTKNIRKRKNCFSNFKNKNSQFGKDYIKNNEYEIDNNNISVNDSKIDQISIDSEVFKVDNKDKVNQRKENYKIAKKYSYMEMLGLKNKNNKEIKTLLEERILEMKKQNKAYNDIKNPIQKIKVLKAINNEVYNKPSLYLRCEKQLDCVNSKINIASLVEDPNKLLAVQENNEIKMVEYCKKLYEQNKQKINYLKNK